MSNVIWPDVVIEKRYESILNTKLDLQRFLSVDYDLAENSGMKKTIVKKTVSGDVEDLAMGYGNSGYIEVGTSSADYEVGVTQGRFAYFDEEAMKDDKVVEAGLEGLAETMINDFNNKAIDEWEKATLVKFDSEWKFADVVDALAMMNLEGEEGFFMLINPAQVAAFRKNLKDDLKYVEAFVRSGYIGSVCGVPVYVSKAVSADNAILAHRDAVTLFIKKGVEREAERDANTRKNTEYIRKVALVALTDASKVVILTSAEDPATGYTALAEQPEDWASKYYTDYYFIDGEGLEAEMKLIPQGTGAPEFVAGKFYSAD